MADHSIPRVPTRITGLDEEMQGGIPHGHVVLMSGSPGTMKTTLAYNMLHHNASAGIKGYYLSLEQSAPALRQHLVNVGYDIDAVRHNVVIEDTLPMRKQLEKYELEGKVPYEHVVRDILGRVHQVKPHIFVVDSLSVIFHLVRDMREQRSIVFHFFRQLKELGITVVVISEMSGDSAQYSESGMEDFIADGIIHLRMVEVSPVDVHRRLRVVKMRATQHEQTQYRIIVGNGQARVLKLVQ